MGIKSVLFGSSIDPNRGKFEDRKYLAGQYKAGIADAQGRVAPQAGMTTMGPVSGVDTARGDQFRGREMQLADQLGSVASGQQAGAGELAARRQGAETMANVLGSARMARGAGAATGGRAAARGAAQVGLSTAGQAATAAVGDQQTARSQLAQVLGQGRAQDTQIAGQDAAARNQAMMQDAQMRQQVEMQNLEAKLRQMGMNDQAVANYLQQFAAMNQAEAANRAGDNGLLPGLLSAGAQVGAAAASSGAAACDERLKEDIRDASEEIDEALAALRPVSWRYTDEAKSTLHIPEGMRERGVGIIAQDLENTSAGKQAVLDIGGHLHIDPAAAIPLLLGMVARLAEREEMLSERVERLEKMLGDQHDEPVAQESVA